MRDIIIKISMLMCCISILASDNKGDERELQKEVTRLLLEEVFSSNSNIWRGTLPASSDQKAQPGDLALHGICGFFNQGYFTLQEIRSHIVLKRVGFFGTYDQVASDTTLNAWFKKAITADGFECTEFFRPLSEYYPDQRICENQKTNPQVKCTVYNIKEGKCWTTFTLTVKKNIFEHYKKIYFDLLLQKNQEKKSEIERRKAILE